MSNAKTILGLALGAAIAGYAVFWVVGGITHAKDTAGGYYYTDEEVAAKIAQCHKVKGTADVYYDTKPGDHFGQAWYVDCEDGIKAIQSFPAPGTVSKRETELQELTTNLMKCWDAGNCATSIGVQPDGYDAMDSVARFNAASKAVDEWLAR